MQYILLPGELHLKNPFVEEDSVANHRPGRGGDCGLAYLATCRRAHQEGHMYYYGHNMFYLPPGEVTYTLEFFYVLDPKHAALIRSLGLKIGLFDVNLENFENVVKYCTDKLGRPLEQSDWMRLAWKHTYRVQDIWCNKLSHISSCHNYTEVKVQYGKSAVLLDGQNLANELQGIRHWFRVRDVDSCNKELSEVLMDFTETLQRSLFGCLFGGGIDMARDWIIRGCPVPLPSSYIMAR